MRRPGRLSAASNCTLKPMFVQRDCRSPRAFAYQEDRIVTPRNHRRKHGAFRLTLAAIFALAAFVLANVASPDAGAFQDKDQGGPKSRSGQTMG